MKSHYLLLCYLLIAHTAMCQYKLKGMVVDAKSQQPLPFVNIVFNFDAQLGTTTDIDGHFNFQSDAALHTLILSYVGYRSDTLKLEGHSSVLNISLTKTSISTQEVVVIAGENPAYRIVRLAAKNRRKHNPELIPQYTYDSYNKLKVYDQFNSPTIHDSIPKEDTLDFYYSLMETISEISYIAPDKRNEHILATQLSGFKHPTFMTAITEIQPTAFHRENFLIIDKEFLNPISDNAIAKYEYRIEDTLYTQRGDTTFVLSFLPRKGKNFDALKGSIYINTNGYALQNIIAEPAEAQKIHLRIQQQYFLADSTTWFPEQLNFEIELTPRRKETYTVQGKRYITNVNLHPDLSPKDISINKSSLAEDATKKSAEYWQAKRLFQLTNKEEKTYTVINKIAKKLPLDLMMDAFTELGEERIVLGPFAVNYTQIMEFNLHEDFRLGLGLYSSNKLSKYVTLGGYFAHGFKDKQWKWGLSLQLRPILNKEFNISFSYIDDIIEPAAIIQRQHVYARSIQPEQSFMRRNILDQMDKTYEMDIAVGFRAFRYLQARFFGNWSNKTPLYDYQYYHNNEWQHHFRIARVGVHLRYSYKEDYVQLGGFNLRARNRFPVLYLSYTQGIEGLLDGQYAYHKITTAVETNFFVKGFGWTNIFAQAGITLGDVPYPILFNGRGSFNRGGIFLVRGTFQTMRPNEFVVDKFTYLFIEHNFGSLLFNTKRFKPELKIYQSIGWGMLENQQLHRGIPIQDMSKGYFESGIMLANLLRLPILNFGHFGVGAGLFIRYGPYWIPNNAWDNMAIKIDMNVSF